MGITPTKAGFQEIIDKVNAWNAANGKATKYQIDNLADAQSALVDYIEMQGIANYASQEALETISGSFAAAKAAWSNLVTGMADDNANIDQLMNNFVDSVSTAGENILPRIEIALQGAAQLIEKLFPKIMERIPTIISNTLPQIVSAGVGIIQGLVNGISSDPGSLVSAAFDAIDTLLNGINDALPDVIDSGAEILLSIMDGITKDPGKILDTAFDIITNLVGGIIKHLPDLAAGAFEMVASLAGYLVEKLPDIFNKGGEIIDNLVNGIINALPKIFDQGVQIVKNIMNGISSMWDELTGWFGGLFDSAFGNKQVNVTVNKHVQTTYGAGSAPILPAHPTNRVVTPGSYINGTHAGGLDYVPFDGYIAELHKGERVLTADDAKSGSIGNVSININGYNQDPRELAEIISEELQNMAERSRAKYA